jgi:hypothetical protein
MVRILIALVCLLLLIAFTESPEEVGVWLAKVEKAYVTERFGE